MANIKKKSKKRIVSFSTTKEVVEALDLIAVDMSEMTGQELSRSNIIEIALLRFLKHYNNYVEEKLKDSENKENKEEN